MCAVRAQPVFRSGVLASGLSFALQVIIAVSAEVADDLGRAIFSQHGTMEGIDHARMLATFEVSHGFFVEPAWQMYFLQAHTVLQWTVSQAAMTRMMNGVYVLGHVFFTLGVALWVYAYRRRWFGLMRNTVILVNVFALVIYENFPVAPPRLTTGLIFNHHPFMFRDTVFGIVNASGREIGTQSGYNEFSAMPSVHMAWAIVAGAALIILAGPLWARALGAIYPICMLIAVVVTGNHYLVDVAGGAGITILAFATAWQLDRWWNDPDRDGRGQALGREVVRKWKYIVARYRLCAYRRWSRHHA
jgi:membrane-associated phospholipid phosphatase